MTTELKKTPNVTFHDCEVLKDFFKGASLLTRACRETGLEMISVRRNLNGPAKQIKLAYVVYLGEWMRLWKEQEAERKLLAKMVEK